MSMSHAKNSLLSLPTGPGGQRGSVVTEDSQGFSTANDALLPPNVRRDNASTWSDDSEVLLTDSNEVQNRHTRFRG